MTVEAAAAAPKRKCSSLNKFIWSTKCAWEVLIGRSTKHEEGEAETQCR